MSDLNNVNLIGRLVRDADVRYMNNGNPVAGFSLAVSKTWKDQNGQKQERTCFIDCSLFGRIVEPIRQYLVKGQQVRVSGELKQDTWEKDGQKHSKIGVNVSEIQLLGGSRSTSSGGNQQGYGNPQGNMAQNQGGGWNQGGGRFDDSAGSGMQNGGASFQGGFQEFPEDIPF